MAALRLVTCCVLLLVAWSSADDATCSPVGLMVECQVSLNDVPTEPVKFAWQRADGSGSSVSQLINFTSTYGNVQLFRFAPLTEYIIEIIPFGSSAMTLDITTGSTGFDQIDNEPLAVVTGTPSYGLVFLDIGNAYAMVDELGWTVWFYGTNGTLPMEPAQAKGQLPNNDFVFLNDGFIQQVKPNLTQVAYGTRYCNPESTSYENHECRPSVDGTRVYSLQQNVVNETVNWDAPSNSILGQLINYWDPATNNYTNLYSSFNIWDSTELWSKASKGLLNVECLEDPRDTVSVTDWSHCNSVSEGPNDNIIISSRSLSSIVSARKDGSGIDWMISTEIESDYTFPNATDKFYNQHDVQELDNGNLLLIDNGADRPASEGKFSRAAEYVVDHDAKTVTLVWEYLPVLPDGTQITCFHGGSVTIFDEGTKRVASFPCDNTSTSDTCSIVAFETDGGTTVATLEFSNIIGAGEKFIGSYRVEPWASINGEA